jgi:hypothetical protein
MSGPSIMHSQSGGGPPSFNLYEKADKSAACLGRDVWRERWCEYEPIDRTLSVYRSKRKRGQPVPELEKKYEVNGVCEVPARAGKRKWRFDVFVREVSDQTAASAESLDHLEKGSKDGEEVSEWRAFAGNSSKSTKKMVEAIKDANHDERLSTEQQMKKFKAERDRKRDFGWRGILNMALFVSLFGAVLGAACTYTSHRVDNSSFAQDALDCGSTVGWLLVLLGLVMASTVSAAPDETSIDFDEFAQDHPRSARVVCLALVVVLASVAATGKPYTDAVVALPFAYVCVRLNHVLARTSRGARRKGTEPNLTFYVQLTIALWPTFSRLAAAGDLYAYFNYDEVVAQHYKGHQPLPRKAMAATGALYVLSSVAYFATWRWCRTYKDPKQRNQPLDKGDQFWIMVCFIRIGACARPEVPRRCTFPI